MGSLTISAIGAGMFFLDRERMYEKAQAISVIGFAFPFLLIVMLAHPFKLNIFSIEIDFAVEFGPKFDLFAQGPLLVVMILNLLWAYPVFLGALKGKALALNYFLLGGISLIGAIYAWPALFSFALSAVGTAIFGTIGTRIYLTEREKEGKMRKILEFIRSRGEASLEEVMVTMRMSDAEAGKLLYEMWNVNLIETVEGKESVYRVREKH